MAVASLVAALEGPWEPCGGRGELAGAGPRRGDGGLAETTEPCGRALERLNALDRGMCVVSRDLERNWGKRRGAQQRRARRAAAWGRCAAAAA